MSTFQLFINENSNRTPKPKMPQTDEFYGFIKSRKQSTFVIDSYLKDSVFTTVKRDESSKQGMLKGYHLSIEGL